MVWPVHEMRVCPVTTLDAPLSVWHLRASGRLQHKISGLAYSCEEGFGAERGGLREGLGQTIEMVGDL